MKTKFEQQVAFSQGHIFPRRYRNVQNLPHWHREHELILVESGSVTVTVGGNLFTLHEGNAAFLHSEEVHCIKADPGAVTAIAKLDTPHFQKLLGDNRLLSPILTGSYVQKATFDALFDEISRQDRYSSVIADSIATQLIAQMLRHEQTVKSASAEPGTVKRYKELLDRIQGSRADITFEEAAAQMHFSKPYFSKFFCTQTGMSFTHYLNTIRISIAVERLQEGGATVTEVSQSCGFNTIRNFNRVFKKMTGFCPNALPKDYHFIHPQKEFSDSGFDPTLSCTEVLE